MTIAKVSATFFFFIVVVSQQVLGDEMTPAKRVDIRALLQASGGGNLPQQFANLTTRNIVQQLHGQPGFTPKVGQSIQDEMVSVFSEGMGPAGALSAKIEEVYGKYYTHKEIKDLLAFFRSPTGQKFVGSATSFSRELIAAGLAWGNSIAPAIDARLRNKLKKEGFDLPTSNVEQGKNRPAQAAPASTSTK